jgi:hypothetical protein
MSSLTSHHDLGVAPGTATQAYSHGPYTTSNAGTFAYAANSAFQRAVYQKCRPYIPDLKGRKSITIVDYVCIIPFHFLGLFTALNMLPYVYKLIN